VLPRHLSATSSDRFRPAAHEYRQRAHLRMLRQISRERNRRQRARQRGVPDVTRLPLGPGLSYRIAGGGRRLFRRSCACSLILAPGSASGTGTVEFVRAQLQTRRRCWVVQSAYCERFLLKSLQSCSVRKQAFGQNFESYIATESQVSCPVDLSHATHPQRRDYAISSDRAARRQSHDVVMILLRGIGT